MTERTLREALDNRAEMFPFNVIAAHVDALAERVKALKERVTVLGDLDVMESNKRHRSAERMIVSICERLKALEDRGIADCYTITPDSKPPRMRLMLSATEYKEYDLAEKGIGDTLVDLDARLKAQEAVFPFAKEAAESLRLLKDAEDDQREGRLTDGDEVRASTGGTASDAGTWTDNMTPEPDDEERLDGVVRQCILSLKYEGPIHGQNVGRANDIIRSACREYAAGLREELDKLNAELAVARPIAVPAVPIEEELRRGIDKIQAYLRDRLGKTDGGAA